LTNHEKLFKVFEKTNISNVKIGYGDFFFAKGKWTIAIESLRRLKYTFNTIYWVSF